MAKIKDMTGQVFGRWTVVGFSHMNDSGAAMWLCECECGIKRAVVGHSLRKGSSKSCGCLAAELSVQATRGHGKHNGRNDRLYGVWHNIKDRCYNPQSEYFYRYGGRGIKVCDEWRSDYAAFREWAFANGYDPTVPKGTKTLDRIDNNGDYSPENCAWHDMKQQSNNRSSNRLIEYNGVVHTATQWAEMIGVERHTILRRIDKLGWDIGRAVTTPSQHTHSAKHKRISTSM